MGRHETENIRVYMGLIWYFEEHFGASLVAQMVKNPPAMQEIWDESLDWEDPLEKGKATHSSIPACRLVGKELDTTEQL